MIELSVDLQDGFDGDTVAVQADGQEVARRENVRTRRMLGLATSLSIQIPNEATKITISVPTKGITQDLAIPAGIRSYIGASVANGKVEAIVSANPFHYA